jgi:hypothetical protein
LTGASIIITATAYNYNQQNIPVSDKAIVTAKTRKENINWIRSFCQDMYVYIHFKFSVRTSSNGQASSGCGLYAYTTDPEQPEEGLLKPFTTKGHEAAAYLTYIVDYYHDLPEFSIFIHGGEEQWHNDLFGSKTIDHLRRVRFEAVQVEGFVNLRCTTAPLCPDTWHPLNPQPNDLEYAYLYELFPSIYTELFNITAAQLPPRIGHICCAQFIVSREMIRRRPLNDYKRILQWIAQTEVTDNYGIGLVMEKLWHIIFGKDPVQYVMDLQLWPKANTESPAVPVKSNAGATYMDCAGHYHLAKYCTRFARSRQPCSHARETLLKLDPLKYIHTSALGITVPQKEHCS